MSASSPGKLSSAPDAFILDAFQMLRSGTKGGRNRKEDFGHLEEAG